MDAELLNNDAPDIEDVQPNVLEMSDEDFLKLAIPEDPVEAEQEEKTPSEDDGAAEAEPEASAEGDEPGAVAEDEAEETDEESAAAEPAEEGETPDAKPEDKTDAAFDYKAEYEKLLAPFKANGRDMQVESIEDARTLMQMGANYNKKMAALKPNLQLLKMLEKNDLLDVSKLNYLIDLEKKNPEAIGKLVKDSGIDPLDLNTESGKEYVPKTYTVDERELALDAVLDEIQDTPTYRDLIDVIGNKWDKSSRDVIADNPQIIKVINEHMTNGIYAQIAPVIERERMMGRLVGMSDIEAYRHIGDRLNAEGRFNTPTQPTPQEIPTPRPTPKKAVNESEIKSRKRAAAPTKAAPAKAPAPDFNPLALSDDEFAKLGLAKFM